VTATIGGKACTELLLFTDEESEERGLRCKAPAGSGSGQKVVLAVAGQEAIGDEHTIDSFGPVVQRVSKNIGSEGGGESVTIFGANFGPESNQVRVMIGSNECPLEGGRNAGTADSVIVCKAPAATGTCHRVTVQAENQRSKPLEMYSYIHDISDHDLVASAMGAQVEVISGPGDITGSTLVSGSKDALFVVGGDAVDDEDEAATNLAARLACDGTTGRTVAQPDFHVVVVDPEIAVAFCNAWNVGGHGGNDCRGSGHGGKRHYLLFMNDGAISVVPKVAPENIVGNLDGLETWAEQLLRPMTKLLFEEEERYGVSGPNNV
jgi:hypothetical protein